MLYFINKRQYDLFLKGVVLCVLVAFVTLTILPSQGFAQILGLPAPGTMVQVGPAFTPPIVRGMTIHPNNPLQLDFIIDQGDQSLQGKAFQKEASKLIKYFLAALTVPEDQLWVNLSPHEQDRIITEEFGKTEMGRDLLAQDYILKQLTASLMYPEDEVGKNFWDKIRKKTEEAGIKDMSVETFNKVWIIPEKASVYVHGTNVFVVDSYLRVMLEQDYVALEYHDRGLDGKGTDLTEETKNVLREIIIPELEREVNEGKHFAKLRQIYHSSILATWYKKNLKDSILTKAYADQNKIKGVDHNDPEATEKIYAQYLKAFKKGVYSFIKEEHDALTNQLIPRKYFSGGANLEMNVDQAILKSDELDHRDLAMVTVNMESDAAMRESETQPVGETMLTNSLSNLAMTEDRAFLSEAVFRMPSGEAEEARLKRIRESFNEELGEWTDEIAKDEAARILAELRNMLTEFFIGSTRIFLNRSFYSRERDEEFFKIIQNIGYLPEVEIQGLIRVYLTSEEYNFKFEGDTSLWGSDDLTRKREEWIAKFRHLKERYLMLTRWDFANRFPNASGMILWRGNLNSEEKDRLARSKTDDRISFQGNFFTHIPLYADNFTKPTLLAYVPLSSISVTSWLYRYAMDSGYEPEIVVHGSVEVLDVFSSEEEVRFQSHRARYERGLEELENLDPRDETFLFTEVLDPGIGNDLQREYLERMGKSRRDGAMTGDSALSESDPGMAFDQQAIYDGIDVRKILILAASRNRGKGDEFISSQLPFVLRDRFPDAQISIMTRDPDIYGGREAAFTFVEPIDGHDEEMDEYLGRHDYDVVFDMTVLPHDAFGLTSASFIRNTRASTPLTVNGLEYRKEDGRVRRFFYEEVPVNFYRIWQSLFTLWGLNGDAFLPQWRGSKEAVKKAAQILSDNRIANNRPIIFINPSSTDEMKELTIDGWSHFFDELRKQDFPFHQYYFIVDQGVERRHFDLARGIAEKIQQITKVEGEDTRYEPLLPRISIAEVAAVIDLSHGTLQADSLFGHVAPSLAVPTLIYYFRDLYSLYPRARYEPPNAEGLDLVGRRHTNFSELAVAFVQLADSARKKWDAAMVVTRAEIETIINKLFPSQKPPRLDAPKRLRLIDQIERMNLVKGSRVLVVGPEGMDYWPIALAQLDLQVSIFDINPELLDEQVSFQGQFEKGKEIRSFSSARDLEGEIFDYIFLLGVVGEVTRLKIDILEERGVSHLVTPFLMNRTLDHLKADLTPMIEPLIRLLAPSGLLLVNDTDPDVMPDAVSAVLDDLMQKDGITLEITEEVDVNNFSLHPGYLGEPRVGLSYRRTDASMFAIKDDEISSRQKRDGVGDASSDGATISLTGNDRQSIAQAAMNLVRQINERKFDLILLSGQQAEGIQELLQAAWRKVIGDPDDMPDVVIISKQGKFYEPFLNLPDGSFRIFLEDELGLKGVRQIEKRNPVFIDDVTFSGAKAITLRVLFHNARIESLAIGVITVSGPIFLDPRSGRIAAETLLQKPNGLIQQAAPMLSERPIVDFAGTISADLANKIQSGLPNREQIDLIIGLIRDAAMTGDASSDGAMTTELIDTLDAATVRTIQYPSLGEMSRRAEPWSTTFDYADEMKLVPAATENMMAKLGIQSGEEVLGFAGHRAQWLLPLARGGARVTYTDVSEEMVAETRFYNGDEFEDVRKADALALPTGRNEYDWSFSFEPNPTRYTGALAIALMRGGLNRKGSIIAASEKHFEMLQAFILGTMDVYGFTIEEGAVPYQMQQNVEGVLNVIKLLTNEQTRENVFIDLRLLEALDKGEDITRLGIERSKLLESIERIQRLSEKINYALAFSVSKERNVHLGDGAMVGGALSDGAMVWTEDRVRDYFRRLSALGVVDSRLQQADGISIFTGFSEMYGDPFFDDNLLLSGIKDIGFEHIDSIGESVFIIHRFGLVMLDTEIHPNASLFHSVVHSNCCSLAVKARNRETQAISLGFGHIHLLGKRGLYELLKQIHERIREREEVLEYIISYDKDTYRKFMEGMPSAEYQERIRQQFTRDFPDDNVVLQFQARESNRSGQLIVRESNVLSVTSVSERLDQELVEDPNARFEVLNWESDNAVLSKKNADIGGIDLGPGNLYLQEGGGEIEFNFPALDSSVLGTNFEGLYPVIINISPVTNLHGMLGLVDENAPESSDQLTFFQKLSLFHRRKV